MVREEEASCCTRFAGAVRWFFAKAMMLSPDVSCMQKFKVLLVVAMKLIAQPT
jgi:hypothetical protein